MTLMARLERWLEWGIEGLFGRRGSVQPVEVGRRIARLMEEQKQVSVNQVYAPNVFRVRLSPGDFSRLASIAPHLSEDLEQHIARVAHRQGYALVGPASVTWDAAEGAGAGTFSVEAAFAPAEEEPRRELRADGAETTVVYRRLGGPGRAAGGPEAGLPELTVARGPDAGRHFPLREGENRVGRAEDNDLVLSDSNVSRHHAAFVREKGRVWVRDASSRNGTRVNGEPVREAELSDGDEVQIGLDVLVYRGP